MLPREVAAILNQRLLETRPSLSHSFLDYCILISIITGGLVTSESFGSSFLQVLSLPASISIFVVRSTLHLNQSALLNETLNPVSSRLVNTHRKDGHSSARQSSTCVAVGEKLNERAHIGYKIKPASVDLFILLSSTSMCIS